MNGVMEGVCGWQVASQKAEGGQAGDQVSPPSSSHVTESGWWAGGFHRQLTSVFRRRQDFQESWEQGERQDYYRQMIINNNNSYKSDLHLHHIGNDDLAKNWRRYNND